LLAVVGDIPDPGGAHRSFEVQGLLVAVEELAGLLQQDAQLCIGVS